MNVFDLPVHPAAEVFPMLPDDELDELAEDIRTNGLRHPLLVKDGQLVDGRNRREACRRAGIEPTTAEVNGIEVEALILSENIARRHLGKSQRAMAVAMLYPDPEKGGRGQKSFVAEEFGTGRLSMARTVLRASRDDALAVLAGASLDAAYKNVKDGETRREDESRRRAALHATDVDLAARVEEGDLTLAQAEDIARERRDDAARDMELAERVLDACEKATGYLSERRHDETRVDSVARYCRERPDRFNKADILKAIKRWETAIANLRKALP